MANGNGTNLATPLAPTTPLAPQGKGKGKGKKAPASVTPDDDAPQYSLEDAATKAATAIKNYQYSTNESSAVVTRLANKRLAKLATSLLQS